MHLDAFDGKGLQLINDRANMKLCCLLTTCFFLGIHALPDPLVLEAILSRAETEFFQDQCDLVAFGSASKLVDTSRVVSILDSG